MDHGQHFTFCCLGHSDLNSISKDLEPNKLKHTLSTLSSKHDYMCHRKICIGQKNHNSEPIIHLKGNFEFSESSKLSPWPFLTVSDIWNFHSSLLIMEIFQKIVPNFEALF